MKRRILGVSGIVIIIAMLSVLMVPTFAYISIYQRGRWTAGIGYNVTGLKCEMRLNHMFSLYYDPVTPAHYWFSAIVIAYNDWNPQASNWVEVGILAECNVAGQITYADIYETYHDYTGYYYSRYYQIDTSYITNGTPIWFCIQQDPYNKNLWHCFASLNGEYGNWFEIDDPLDFGEYWVGSAVISELEYEDLVYHFPPPSVYSIANLQYLETQKDNWDFFSTNFVAEYSPNPIPLVESHQYFNCWWADLHCPP